MNFSIEQLTIFFLIGVGFFPFLLTPYAPQQIFPDSAATIKRLEKLIGFYLLYYIYHEQSWDLYLLPWAILKGELFDLLIHSVPHAQYLLTSFWFLVALNFIVGLSGLCLIFDRLPKLSLTAGWIGLFILAGLSREIIGFNHSGMIMVYLIPILLIRYYTALRDDFILTLFIAVISLCYFSAGISKLLIGGLAWWYPSNLRSTLLTSSLSSIRYTHNTLFIIEKIPSALFGFFGLLGLFGELLFGWVLILRRGRWIFPLLLLGMHLGIFILQKIFFCDFILLDGFFIIVFLSQHSPKKVQWHRGYSILFLFISIFQTLVALKTVELFPLTPFAMYAIRRDTGDITYLRTRLLIDGSEETEFHLYTLFPVTGDRCYFLLAKMIEDPSAYRDFAYTAVSRYLHGKTSDGKTTQLFVESVVRDSSGFEHTMKSIELLH